MILYNTLTREKETLMTLVPGEVSIYSCGPTVYSDAHIGNMRSYIFMDILRRVLQYEGYKLRHCMNITDVGHLVSDADEGEDKMVKAAKAQNISPYEIAEKYTRFFYRDIALLNIERPEIVARATEHVPEMIEFVRGLCDRGYGYETADGIYFDIGKFPDYGKLSRINLEEQMAGARVEVNEEKHNPLDFALWIKAPKEHIMQWESPWGMGYPGWHIECSAMSRKYLGDTFDIHTGGVDHIPIHHENEIAQSDCLLGHPAVRYWMHGEFLLVDNGKMSKSLGNAYTLTRLEEEGVEPLAYRYFCLNANYRNKLNFTWDAVRSAGTSLSNLYAAVYAHKSGKNELPAEKLESYRTGFAAAVSDDLNIPKALGLLWTVLRSEKPSQAVYDFALDTDRIFGLDFAKYTPAEKTAEEIPAEVLALAEKRRQARSAKDFKTSDELRDQINAMGYSVADTPEGPKVTRDRS